MNCKQFLCTYYSLLYLISYVCVYMFMWTWICFCVCVFVYVCTRIFKQQTDSLNSKLSREEEELESLKSECNDAGCKIQSLQAETESMRALVGTLERMNALPASCLNRAKIRIRLGPSL